MEITSATSPQWLALLLQTSDPLFPTGAYAHSLGLEEIVRLGVVHNEATLRDFLRQQVLPSLQRLELPLLRRAHDAVIADDLYILLELNAELDGWKLARELREASLQLGTRRLQMLLKIAPTPFLQRFTDVTSGKAHHLIVCALQGASMPLEAVLTGYLYLSLAGHCSAALKLIRIGQEGCQRTLSESLADIDTVIQASLQVPDAEVGWFSPVLEIAAMRHERAYERLFIS